MMEFVSWNDSEIPNWMGKYNMFQTTNQIRVFIAWYSYDIHSKSSNSNNNTNNNNTNKQ